MLDHRGAPGDATHAATGDAADGRSNSEKLDDAGLLTDVAFANYRETLDALPPEVVNQMIEAFNDQQAWRSAEDSRQSR